MKIFIYLLINLLFVYKYGSRIIGSYVYLLIPVYIAFILFYKVILEKYKERLKKPFFNKLYFFITVIFIVLFILINYYSNDHQLNVDRWSAMEAGIRSLLSGEYPYTAIDHLGGRTSNFPGLFLIGLPFYLMGSVGYLQVFTFALLAWCIYSFFTTNEKRLLVLGLLLFSPAYYWEIAVKSDLMSNIIIVLTFLLFWYARFKNNFFIKPILLGCIVGILILTRGIVYLPLTIFLLKPFVTDFGKAQLKFLVSLLLTLVILILPIYLSMPSWDIVKEKNPLILQTSSLPSYAILSILILVVFVAFKTKNLEQKLTASYALILLSSTISFLFLLKDYSWHQLILGSRFDISYFGMALPFLLFSIGFQKKYLIKN